MHDGGANVYLATDVTVLDNVLKTLPTSPAKQLHAAEWSVDPKLLANGLSQVPLLDAMQSGELAGALAAGTEPYQGRCSWAPRRSWAGQTRCPAPAIGVSSRGR